MIRSHAMKRFLKAFFLIIGVIFICIFFAIGQFFIPAISYIMYPLHMSVRHEITPLVYILSNVGLKNQRKPGLKGGCRVPLQEALQTGSFTSIDILLDSGANLNQCSQYSILEIASSNPALVDHLLNEKKIDPLITNPSPQSDFAILRNMSCKEGLEVMNMFLDAGVDPNIRSKGSYWTHEFASNPPLLAVVALRGCPAQIRMLLDRKADPYIAEQALHDYFKNKKVHEENTFYSFLLNDVHSERTKENIRIIKRAAGK